MGAEELPDGAAISGLSLHQHCGPVRSHHVPDQATVNTDTSNQ